jgi:hypothetical protein
MIIYKIVCNDLTITNIYVGSTTNLVSRKSNHKICCNDEKKKNHNTKLYKNIRENGGWENWSVIKICDFPCNSKEEARTEERRYLELLNADLNTYNPIPSEDEKREQIINRNKKHYENNKIESLEIKKKYREANREKVAEYQKKYYEVNREYHKKYYEANREKIAEYHKKYREDNRELSF